MSYASPSLGAEVRYSSRREPNLSGRPVTGHCVLGYGEDAREKLKNLVREDLGVELEQMAPLQVQSQVGEHWCLCLLYSGRIRNMGKLSKSIIEIGFFDPKKPPEGTHEFHRYVLEDLVLGSIRRKESRS